LNASPENTSTLILKDDPTLLPAFSLRNRVARTLWNICYALLYRLSPRPLHTWRAFLLRAFGAKLGLSCHFYPKGKIWAPWNLVCEDRVTLADDAELYNPSLMYLGSHATVSQGAYVCGRDPSLQRAFIPAGVGAIVAAVGKVIRCQPCKTLLTF